MMLLAKADLTDRSFDLPLILGGFFIVAGAAFLAFFPIRSARIRNHRFAEALTAAVILWALAACASAIYTLFERAKFASDQNQLAANGLLDLSLQNTPPPYPWPIWIALGAAYIGLIVFASLSKPRPTP